MSTIFLDRDGVINENRADYVKSWQEFQFLPGAIEAIVQLTRMGHRLIVCTNQAGVARGIIPVEVIEDIHARMLMQIRAAGGYIERVYYCPHGRDGKCVCRKPRPGMLLRARDELGLDMNDAVFIGDSVTDVQAARAAGIQPILVLTGLGIEQLQQYAHTIEGTLPIMENITEAVLHIMQRRYATVNGAYTVQMSLDDMKFYLGMPYVPHSL